MLIIKLLENPLNSDSAADTATRLMILHRMFYAELCDKKGNVLRVVPYIYIYIYIVLTPSQIFAPCLEIIFFINHNFLVCIFNYCISSREFDLYLYFYSGPEI